MHFFAECKEGVDVCVRGDLCDAMIRPRLEEGEVDVEVAARVRAMQRCTGVQCRRPLLPTSDPSGWDTSALGGARPCSGARVPSTQSFDQCQGSPPIPERVRCRGWWVD
jgi:hypothetical protein